MEQSIAIKIHLIWRLIGCSSVTKNNVIVEIKSSKFVREKHDKKRFVNFEPDYIFELKSIFFCFLFILIGSKVQMEIPRVLLKVCHKA